MKKEFGFWRKVEEITKNISDKDLKIINISSIKLIGEVFSDDPADPKLIINYIESEGHIVGEEIYGAYNIVEKLRKLEDVILMKKGKNISLN
jgi:hypothetical protein